MAKPRKYLFGRDILFNLMSVVDWRVVTAAKQSQVNIDNFRDNNRPVTHDYAIGDQFYVEMTGIYCKLDYKKQGLYRITKVFTNDTVQFQRIQVNKLINIRQLNPNLDE